VSISSNFLLYIDESSFEFELKTVTRNLSAITPTLTPTLTQHRVPQLDNFWPMIAELWSRR